MSTTSSHALCLLFLGSGCVGAIATDAAPAEGGSTPGLPTAGGASSPRTPGGENGTSCGPGTTPLRRLSHREYRNTVRDLFRGRLPTTGIDLPSDQTGKGFDNNADTLSASPLLVESYHTVANDIARTAAAGADLFMGIAGCPPANAAAQPACARAFIEALGGRAFRRPLAPAEVDELFAVFDKASREVDFAAGIQLTIATLLEQPEFLYRIEVSGQDGKSPVVPLGPYELASRLSYLIWQSMPDDALFSAARAGQLRTPAEIETQARRMLADAKARAVVVDFHRQWLELDRLEDEKQKDAKLYPQWTAALAAAVREESDRFISDVIFDRRGTLRDLLTSPRTWVNAPLATLYSVASPGTAWAAVMLPPEQRAGFFTRPNFLASHAHGRNGSPPLRGVAIFQRAFCAKLPPPPPDADQSNPAAAATSTPKTNRQLFEERTASAACSACHGILDGFGYGLENFDAVGGFRTTDNGLPVDARSVLKGTDVDGPYTGPVELSRRMADSEQVASCLVTFWYGYAGGRVAAAEDGCRLGALLGGFKQNGQRFLDLILATATAPDFAQRTVSR